MKWLHFVADLFGLSGLLGYLAVWSYVYRGGGQATAYFSHGWFGWVERNVEPILLATMIGIVVADTIMALGALRWKNK